MPFKLERQERRSAEVGKDISLPRSNTFLLVFHIFLPPPVAGCRVYFSGVTAWLLVSLVSAAAAGAAAAPLAGAGTAAGAAVGCGAAGSPLVGNRAAPHTLVLTKRCGVVDGCVSGDCPVVSWAQYYA